MDANDDGQQPAAFELQELLALLCHLRDDVNHALDEIGIPPDRLIGASDYVAGGLETLEGYVNR